MTFSLPRVLLVIVLGLAVVVAWQVASLETQWQAPSAIKPATVETVGLPPTVAEDSRLGTLATLNALEEAPLFWPSRRPPPDKPKEPVESPPEENPLEGVRLLGAFTAPGQGGAVLSIESDKGEPKLERLTVGESYAGLTLTNVSPVAVEFEDRDGKKRNLPLEIERIEIDSLPVD